MAIDNEVEGTVKKHKQGIVRRTEERHIFDYLKKLYEKGACNRSHFKSSSFMIYSYMDVIPNYRLMWR